MRAPDDDVIRDGASRPAPGSDREELGGLVSEIRGRGGDPRGQGREYDTDKNPWGSYPEGDQRPSEERRGIPLRPPRAPESPDEPGRAGPEPRTLPESVGQAGTEERGPGKGAAAEEPATEELEPISAPLAAGETALEPEKRMPAAQPERNMTPHRAIPGRSAEDELAAAGRANRTAPRPPAGPNMPPRARTAQDGGPRRGSAGEPPNRPPAGPPPAPPGPASPPNPPGEPQPGSPPGLREQVGRTKAAAFGLVRAHTDLAKAELAEIMEEVKRLSVVIGLAIGLGLFVGLLIPIGLTLFLGEWLFGSMGWGILHGTLFSIALIVAAFAAYLGLPRSMVIGTFFASVIVGVLVGVVFGLNLSNELWRRIGESAFPALVPETRPLVVGIGVMAAVVGVLAFIAGLRGGIGTAIGALIVGAILGALLGAFSAITFGQQVGAALGVAVALLLWPILIALVLSRRGIDFDALKARFTPEITIETTKETIEWVRRRTPLGRKS